MPKKYENRSEIEILDNPGLLSVVRNIGEWSFTSVMWVLWIYLFLPVVNILLWVFGIEHFYQKVVAHSEYLQLLDLIRKCGWIILIVFLVLWFWGFYNYHRFGKRDRRSRNAPVAPEKLAAFFNVPVDQVLAMQQQKEMRWSSLYQTVEPGDFL